MGSFRGLERSSWDSERPYGKFDYSNTERKYDM